MAETHKASLSQSEEGGRVHAELAVKVKKVRDDIRDFNKMLVQEAPPEVQAKYAELADRLHYAERDCTAWLKAHDQN